MAAARSLLDVDEAELVEMLTPMKLNPLETLAVAAAEERHVLLGEAGSSLETQAKPRGKGSSTNAVVGLSEAGRKPGTDQPGEKHSAAEESGKEWSPLNRDKRRMDDRHSSTRRHSRKDRETHLKSSRRRRSTSSSSSSSSSSDQSDKERTERVMKERHRTVNARDQVVKDAHNTRAPIANSR